MKFGVVDYYIEIKHSYNRYISMIWNKWFCTYECGWLKRCSYQFLLISEVGSLTEYSVFWFIAKIDSDWRSNVWNMSKIYARKGNFLLPIVGHKSIYILKAFRIRRFEVDQLYFFSFFFVSLLFDMKTICLIVMRW